MTDTVSASLLLDLLEWIARRERTYEETMDAWRTSCPKLPVWEEATERALVTTETGVGGLMVHLTQAGEEFLLERRREPT